MKRKIEINEKTVRIVTEYLSGDLSTRAAARELEISHQQVINLIASLFKEWYLAGKVQFTPNNPVISSANGQQNPQTT